MMMKKLMLWWVAASMLLMGAGRVDEQATAYFQRGMDEFSHQDFLGAIGQFSNAIFLAPDYAEAYYMRAMAKDLFGRDKGFPSSVVCADLLQAMRHGSVPAIAKLDAVHERECNSLPMALSAPEDTYCVDMSNAGLQEVPAELQQLSVLTGLSLSRNAIEELSPLLTDMMFLVRLEVDHNRLQRLCPDIDKFRWLYRLDASHNQIAEVPASIGNMPFLHTLNLRNNKVRQLPEQLEGLRSLRVLDLSHNALANLPVVLSKLSHLEVLVLTGNPLKPSEVKALSKQLPKTKVVFEALGAR